MVAALLACAFPATATDEDPHPSWLAVDIIVGEGGTFFYEFEMTDEARVHYFPRSNGRWEAMTTSIVRDDPVRADITAAGHRARFEPTLHDRTSGISLLPLLAGEHLRLVLINDGPVRDQHWWLEGDATGVELGRGTDVTVVRAAEFGGISADASVGGELGPRASVGGTRSLTIADGAFGFFGTFFTADAGMRERVEGPQGSFDCPCQFRAGNTTPPMLPGEHRFTVTGAGAGVPLSDTPLLVLAQIPDLGA